MYIIERFERISNEMVECRVRVQDIPVDFQIRFTDLARGSSAFQPKFKSNRDSNLVEYVDESRAFRKLVHRYVMGKADLSNLPIVVESDWYYGLIGGNEEWGHIPDKIPRRGDIAIHFLSRINEDIACCVTQGGNLLEFTARLVRNEDLEEFGIPRPHGFQINGISDEEEALLVRSAEFLGFTKVLSAYIRGEDVELPTTVGYDRPQ